EGVERRGRAGALEPLDEAHAGALLLDQRGKLGRGFGDRTAGIVGAARFEVGGAGDRSMGEAARFAGVEGAEALCENGREPLRRRGLAGGGGGVGGGGRGGALGGWAGEGAGG